MEITSVTPALSSPIRCSSHSHIVYLSKIALSKGASLHIRREYPEFSRLLQNRQAERTDIACKEREESSAVLRGILKEKEAMLKWVMGEAAEADRRADSVKTESARYVTREEVVQM